MDASTEGLADAHEYPEIQFRRIPRQRNLLSNQNDALDPLCMLLWRDL